MTEAASSQAAPQMRDFVLGIAQALVDSPESVRVATDNGDSDPVLQVLVREEDLERLQGKNGRTARSLRTIVAAAGQKLGSRFALDITTLE